MTCELALDDGAFVIGALSPAERSAFQAHLAGCAECTRAVQELAGLPGLLGRVQADGLDQPQDRPVPETLLPALASGVRRARRRRTWSAIAAAAAAVVVVAGGSLALGLTLGDDVPATDAPSAVEPPSDSAGGQAMTPVGPDVMSADLALTSTAWGTRLDLTCSYPQPSDAWNPADPWTYSLVVLTSDGASEQVATWAALPGRTMQLAAATAAERDDITAVEIRTADGETLLELAT